MAPGLPGDVLNSAFRTWEEQGPGGTWQRHVTSGTAFRRAVLEPYACQVPRRYTPRNLTE